MKLYLVPFASIVTASLVLAQQPRTSQDGIYSAAQATRGETTFLQNCAPCHGADLSGAEGGPALIGGEASQYWNGLKLSELFERIKTTMPQSAPGSLADRQYADLLAFILSKNDFPAGATDLPFQRELLSEITYKVPSR